MSDRIAAGILIVVAAAYVWRTLLITTGFFSDPLGPRFVPLVIAGFVIASCVALLARPRSTTSWPDAPTWARLAACLAGFVAYGLLLVPLGFIAATTLAFTAFALLFRGPPLRALLAGVAFSLASYGLFAVALDLFLPTGRLFEGWF